MKFTILHSNDRIASIFKQAKSVVKQLPLDEMQQHWDKFVKNVTDKMNDTLQDQIEKLTFQLKDQEEINTKLASRNIELELKIDSALATQVNHMKLQDDLNTAEHQIVSLKEELKVQFLNRDHFRQLVAEQDTFIKDLKVQVEAYKATKQKELTNYKDL